MTDPTMYSSYFHNLYSKPERLDSNDQIPDFLTIWILRFFLDVISVFLILKVCD